jgi:hypothetical protein
MHYILFTADLFHRIEDSIVDPTIQKINNYCFRFVSEPNLFGTCTREDPTNM